MKKNLFYIFGIIVLVVTGFLFLNNTDQSNNIQENNVDRTQGNVGIENGVQKVTLSIRDYNYYPNTVTVQAGKPVRIYLDKTVVGCYRSFTIKDFGIAKYLATPNDYVEFTPQTPGTYRFACSMGMGTGTLIVE